MKLTKKSETSSKITFTYDKPPGPVEGYLYYAGGVKVSRTFNPNDLEVTFGKVESGTYAVEAVGFSTMARAEWPDTPPSAWPAAPIGPFRNETGDHFYRDGDGLLTEKLFVTSAPGYGIANMRWNGGAPPAQQCPPPSTGTWVLKDCKVKDVSATPPRSMDGTGEAGFWVGEKTQGERLEAWNCAWMNMVTLANCAGSRFTDLDLHDNPHVGLYMEHVSTNIEFRRSSFGGPRLGVVPDSSSINVEWTYEDAVYAARMPFPTTKAGSYGCQFIDCRIYCPLSPSGSSKPYEINGAFLDGGTFDFLFERCTFWGPGNALGFPNKLLDPSKPNRAVDCVFDNDGAEITYHDNGIG